MNIGTLFLRSGAIGCQNLKIKYFFHNLENLSEYAPGWIFLIPRISNQSLSLFFRLWEITFNFFQFVAPKREESNLCYFYVWNKLLD